MYGSYSGRAGGDIRPARFVKLTQSSGEPQILECDANEAVWGISPQWSRRMALSGWDDGFAAVAGDTMNVYGPGDDEAVLEIAEACEAGAYLQSDADGKGVLATTDKDHVGAVAKHGGAAGDLIKVKPVRFDLAA